MSQKVSTNIPGINIFDSRFLGIYRGIVKDNNDPLKLGRVKVEVFPMFEGIQIDNLPWAIISQPLFSGAGIGYGNFFVPEVDSNVYVMFEQGNCHQPIIIGEAQDALKGQFNEKNSNYPNNKILKTKQGTTISINETLKEVNLNHCGANIKIDSQGNITITGTTVSIN